MAISRLAPTSFSTEGIATVKITNTSSITTLSTPLAAGTYKVSSGYSGSIAVTFYNSSDAPLTYFTFATQGMFTLASTATKVGIVAPTAAINGIVDFQLLQRGVSASAVGTTSWGSKTLANNVATLNSSMQIVNGYLYVIGGTTSSSWDNNDGIAVIQRWDMNPANSFSVVYSGGGITGANSSVSVGNYIYFNRGNASVGFYRFDTTNNTLTTLASRPYLAGIQNLVINNAGTKIYSFGSYNSAAPGHSYVYDIAANTWTLLASLPFNTEWGSGNHRCTSNSDVIFIYGMVNQGARYRYNIAANTYTLLGGTSVSVYTNWGTITPNGNYYLYAKTPGGTPESQFHILKNDGTEDAQYVYSPTAAALYRDSVISLTANNNQGNCVAADANNIFVHTNGYPSSILYTATTPFLGPLN